jgi:tetrahydromethanopterin S-methyltransferase subunit G
MPEKSWDEMTIDEKLGVLRAEIQWLIDAGNANNATLDARDNTITERLSEVEEKVNKILAEVQKNKPSASP